MSISSSGTSLTISTDKNAYGFSDYVTISGTVDKPIEGKTVRLDVYYPMGRVFEPFIQSNNMSVVPGYIPQSDIQVRPNEEGFFAYRFPLSSPIQEVNGTH